LAHFYSDVSSPTLSPSPSLDDVKIIALQHLPLPFSLPRQSPHSPRLSFSSPFQGDVRHNRFLFRALYNTSTGGRGGWIQDFEIFFLPDIKGPREREGLVASLGSRLSSDFRCVVLFTTSINQPPNISISNDILRQHENFQRGQGSRKNGC